MVHISASAGTARSTSSAPMAMIAAAAAADSRGERQRARRRAAPRWPAGRSARSRRPTPATQSRAGTTMCASVTSSPANTASRDAAEADEQRDRGPGAAEVERLRQRGRAVAPQRHAEIVEIVAGPLHRAVAHAPAYAAQARPAQFAQAHRARRGGGVGEQPAALASAADQMLDADVIGHLPEVDGGDRPVRRRRSRTRRDRPSRWG